MLKLVFLNRSFYADFAECTEIEQKPTRPYIRIKIIVDGVLWALPLRSSIKHDYAIWTDKEHGCGIDLTKAVVVTDPGKYIDTVVPHIRDNEFRVLKTIDEYHVAEKLRRYIQTYKKAKERPNIKRNRDLLRWSTLQYFEEYI